MGRNAEPIWTRVVFYPSVVVIVLGILGSCSLPFSNNPDETGGTDQTGYDYLLIDDIDSLRSATGTTHSAIWEQLSGFADAVIAGTEDQIAAVPPDQPPSDVSAQNYFRTHGNALTALALAALVGEDPRHIEIAKEYLLAVSGWDRWDIDGNDLGHIHMIIGVSLAYDWIGGMLGETGRATVESALGYWAHHRYRNAVEPYRSDWRNWWFKSYIQNHSGSNYAAMGLAALALDDVDDRAELWLAAATANWTVIRDLLNDIGDGTWHEGWTYQWYQFQTAIPFLYTLRQKTETDLFPHEQWQKHVSFVAYTHLPGSHQWATPWGNVSTWPWPHASPVSVLRFLANEYRSEEAAYLANRFLDSYTRYPDVWSFPYVAYEFLFYDPTVRSVSPEAAGRSLTHRFTDAEVVVARESWDADAVVFGIKSGPYGGRSIFAAFQNGTAPFDDPGVDANVGHNHRDAGTIWIARGDEWLLPEDVRYEGYETSLHNTLLIDGEGQANYTPDRPGLDAITRGDHYDAEILSSVDTDEYTFVESDLTRAYGTMPGVQQVRRLVVYLRPETIVVLDNLFADTPREWSSVFHANGSVSVSGDRITLTSAGGAFLGIQSLYVPEAAPAAPTIATGTTAYGMPEVSLTTTTTSGVTSARQVKMLTAPREGGWSAAPTATLSEATSSRVQVTIEEAGGLRRKVTFNLGANSEHSTVEVVRQ